MSKPTAPKPYGDREVSFFTGSEDLDGEDESS